MRWMPKGCTSGVMVIVVMLVGLDAAAGMEIAGTTPDRRPDNAPRIEQVQKPGQWYGQALMGIEQPIPHSLRFLSDQGNWYTPFNHPGMPGRYDLRGWHRAPSSGEVAQ